MLKSNTFYHIVCLLLLLQESTAGGSIWGICISAHLCFIVFHPDAMWQSYYCWSWLKQYTSIYVIVYQSNQFRSQASPRLVNATSAISHLTTPSQPPRQNNDTRHTRQIDEHKRDKTAMFLVDIQNTLCQVACLHILQLTWRMKSDLTTWSMFLLYLYIL